MHHAKIVSNAVAGLHEDLQQEQTQIDTPTIVQVPVDHVSNTVQITHKQLATQIQQMQSMIQTIQMHYNAVPHGTIQDYGGRGYQGNQSSYCVRGRCGTQNNSNWCGGRGGRANSNIKHYCCTHIMYAHPRKDCRTPSDGHQKDAV